MTRRILIYSLITAFAAALLTVLAHVIAPQLVTERLARNLKAQTGLEFSQAGRGGLSLFDGVISLEGVALSRNGAQSTPLVTASRLDVPLNFASLFSTPSLIILEDAVVNYGFERSATPVAASPTQATQQRVTIEFRNSALKLAELTSGTLLVAEDINGSVVRDEFGALLMDLRGIYNAGATQLTASFDDAFRLVSNGSPADIAITSGNHTLTFSGRAILGRNIALDGVMTAASDNTAAFSSWVGLPTQQLMSPLTLSSSTSISGLSAKLTGVELTFGESKSNGSLTLEASEKGLMLDGALQANRIDLAALVGLGTPDFRSPWREVEFSHLAHAGVSGKLKVIADELSYGAAIATQATVDASFDSGASTFQIATVVPAVNASLNLTTGDGSTSVEMNGTFEGAALELGRIFNVPTYDGTAKLTANIKGSGKNAAALVGSLSGTMDADLTGKFPGSYAALFPEANTGVTMILADGIATINKSKVTGVIDLLRQNVDLTRGKQKFSGPWASPTLAAPQP